MHHYVWMRSLLILGLSVACSARPTFSDSDSDLRDPLLRPNLAGGTSATADPVLTYHNSNTRDGLYVVPGLTRAAAAKTHLVPWDGRYAGSVYAQPLFVAGAPGESGRLYVVTENNDVVALDESTGSVVWTKNLGPYANQEGGGCGGLNPLGVTGTPVIDLPTRTLYVDGVDVTDPDANGKRTLRSHRVHAISIDDGTERQGWPLDMAGVVSNNHTFETNVAHQRGALALVNGRLLVAYGSQGDCGNYRGTVVSIAIDANPPNNASPSVSWSTPISAWISPGPAAGVWAPNGVASDGKSIFFATGNGGGDATHDWGGGEAVFRFGSGGVKGIPDDVFVASDWRALDMADEDLGGSGVLIVDQPGAPIPELAIALGKDGNMLALDAAHLGGAVGVPPLLLLHVATHDIVDAPAAVPFLGGTMVVFDTQSGGVGVGCPANQSGDLVGVQVMPGNPPTATVAWCNDGWGHGSPIITTTDGASDPIVWMTGGGGGDNALRAYDAADGHVIVDASNDGVSMPGMNRFNTLIVANQKLVVAANNRAYKFSWE